MPQRLRNRWISPPLNWRPRADRRPSVLRIAAISPSIFRSATSAKARREMIEVGIVGISPHLSTDRMLAGCARLPDHPDPDPSPLAVLIKDHLLDEKAQDLFALGRRRGCGIPQLRQILAQGDNLRALGRAQRCRLLATPTLVFRFNLLDLAEPLLPGALKRTRHQPVLRLHGIVLPAGPLRLVMGPLAPERPLALQQAGLFLKLAPS